MDVTKNNDASSSAYFFYFVLPGFINNTKLARVSSRLEKLHQSIDMKRKQKPCLAADSCKQRANCLFVCGLFVRNDATSLQLSILSFRPAQREMHNKSVIIISGLFYGRTAGAFERVGSVVARGKRKGGCQSCSETIGPLVAAQEHNVGCNCTSSEKATESCRLRSRLTLIAVAADKVTSPTIIWGT